MNNNQEQFNKMTDERIEKILGGTPKFERSPEAEAKFFKQLEIAAVKKLALQQTRYARTEAGEKLRPADMLTDELADETRQSSRAWFAWPRLAFTGSFAALLLVVGGTFASYQDSTTRGDLLYGVKQVAEKVELAFSFSDMGKVDTHLRFSDRRLREAENIVEENPSLAWLFKTASADDGNPEINLDSKEERYLSLTLADMQAQIGFATRIVEEKVDVAVKAEAALAKIEAVTDNHVVALSKIEKKVAPKIKIIVKQVAREEDDRIAAVVEAREDVKIAIAEKRKNIKVHLVKQAVVTAITSSVPEVSKISSPELMMEAAAMPVFSEKPNEEANAELTEVQRVFGTLSKDQQAKFKEKMDTAREAFASGKYGKTKGLSRSLSKQFDKFSKSEPKPKPKPKPSTENTTPEFIPTEEEKPDILRQQYDTDYDKSPDIAPETVTSTEYPVIHPSLILDPEKLPGTDAGTENFNKIN